MEYSPTCAPRARSGGHTLRIPPGVLSGSRTHHSVSSARPSSGGSTLLGLMSRFTTQASCPARRELKMSSPIPATFLRRQCARRADCIGRRSVRDVFHDNPWIASLNCHQVEDTHGVWIVQPGDLASRAHRLTLQSAYPPRPGKIQFLSHSEAGLGRRRVAWSEDRPQAGLWSVVAVCEVGL